MSVHCITATPTRWPGIVAVNACSSRSFARHTHDQFGIGLVDVGAQVSASGRGPVEVVAGDLITVNPGEVHDGLAIGDRGRSWRIVYLDPCSLSDLTSHSGEFAFPSLRDPRLADSFRRLFRALPDASCRLAVEAELTTLTRALKDRPRRQAPAVGPVFQAVQALRDDPARPVSLAQLAQISGQSRFQFLRSFARMTGLTPHAFRLQARLHLARRLILTGQSLADVAAEAGFADQSHLTRLFTRSYGMTPGGYARNFVQDRRIDLAE
jgi:AraC-like DNA-binding protein